MSMFFYCALRTAHCALHYVLRTAYYRALHTSSNP